MMKDALSEHLDALKRDDCLRVGAVLKHSGFETTELVYFVGENGAELGPFVRKRIDRDAGVGTAYERIYAKQQAGQRFLYVPRVVDFHEEGESLVVLMEYVKGETLADAVSRRPPTPAFAEDVFPRLCDAVSEIHERFDIPLIHRDLKPSNVMLSRDGMTIIDFGIARSYKEGSDEDTRHFGTRSYAPPEQFGFGQTDVRSDVYALGMLLYFCLTGETPEPRTRKEGFRDERVPAALRAVVTHATALDPDERYASASELKGAFLAAVGGEGKSAAGESTTGRGGAGPASEAAGTASPPRSMLGRALGRIPFSVGVAWDVILAASFAFLAVAAVASALSPGEGSSLAATDPLARVLCYGSLLLLVISPLLFSVSDRRPLVRLIPALRRLSVERSLAVCFVLLVIGLALFGTLNR